MKKFIKAFILAVVSITMMSCATLFSPKKNPQVTVQSTPMDAEVYINGEYVGNTPLVRKLSHKEEHSITVRKEGYRQQNRALVNRVGGGWIVLNILGGLIPIIVDLATGDWYELEEESVHILLQEEDTE